MTGLEDLGVVGSTTRGRPIRRVRCLRCARVYERAASPAALRRVRHCAACRRSGGPKVDEVSNREYLRSLGYRVVCVSLPETVLQALDAKVAALRARGARVDRSKFIREAVARLSVEEYGRR